jgi:hypothetical protein
VAPLLNRAVEEMIASTYRSFADWLRQIAEPDLDEDRAVSIASVALGSLLAQRLLRDVVGVEALTIDDDAIIATWVEMVMSVLPHPKAPASEPDISV